MHHLRRLISLRIARVPRVWFRRRAETEFHSSMDQIVETNPQKKFAIARRARQRREPSALLRILRSRYVIACALVLPLVMIAFVWWLPISSELQTSSAGTLTLLDCRGREIAELASSEARTQFPVTLEQMGTWLPLIN